jgi:hypothetical protein
MRRQRQSRDDKATTCYGCEKPFPVVNDGPNEKTTLVYSVRMAPDVRVDLCSTRERWGPRKACRLKAIEKSRWCPGCGKEFPKYSHRDDATGRTDTAHGTKVCNSCEDAIESASKSRREWKRLDRLPLQGNLIEYLGAGPDMRLVRELAETVLRALDSTGTKRSSEWVLMTEDQAEAADALGNVLSLALEDAYTRGREAGQRLLLQLGEGTLSVSDFEDASLKARRERDEVVARVEALDA